MSKFHKLTVADIKNETPDCVSVTFDVPSDLLNDYQYIHGQHLTLKLMVNGKEVRRSYSLCSSPMMKEPLKVAVKRVKGGLGSNFIYDNLKKGDTLEVMTPMGNFHTELKNTNRKHYALFAGGSGITPMMSIIKTTLLAEPQSKLTLFYGNFDENATIFKKELDELVSQNPRRLTLYYIFEKPGTSNFPADLVGMLTKEKVKEVISKYLERNPVIEYFICGPGPMMDNVKDVLESNNVNKAFIHIEYFTSAIEEPKKDAADIHGDMCEVTVIADGRETIFQLATDGDAILDAAMDAGVDAPFSCKGAVCATCRAKVMEGKVSMTMNYALTDDEVEEGYILTCQAHPTTPVVVVDYDR
ncbi:MAG TPA: 2Fe-2S iron-sulfur cluster-binding protein [Bacteroidia bacterium]|nr:2Fe-2S iron-sulfur cluster-binding protein [Bacteroidia bacterium]